jgi:hypothetical protein
MPTHLISSQDAATLTGVTFGEGIEGTVPGGGKTCTYGSQTTNVFYIEVAQAPDEASAKAAQDQFISDLQANLQQLISGGFVVSQLASFADGAVTATLNVSAGGITVNGSAFGFRKGTVFFGFSDVTEGGAAPSDTAMQNQAQTVLDMLP